MESLKPIACAKCGPKARCCFTLAQLKKPDDRRVCMQCQRKARKLARGRSHTGRDWREFIINDTVPDDFIIKP